MPWSGSAGSQTFSRTDGTRTGATTWTQAAAAPVNILATDHDTHDQDVADGVNACFKKDGGNTATADLPMGGFKLTNVGVAAARTQYARFSQVQDNAAQYIATVGGTADVITLTPAIAITAYAAGQRFTFIAGGTNTGTTTINVSTVGAKDIKRPDASLSALSAGDMVSGTIVDIEYDGTRFLLMSWKSGADISLDTTPQLGGNLDANGFSIGFDDATGITDDSGNEQIRFQKTASAVNQIDVTNAATGNAPRFDATGDDTNIDLTLAGKGTGGVVAAFKSDTGLGLLDSNSSHALQLKTSSNLTATRQLDLVTGDSNRTVTLGGNLTVAGDATIPSGFTGGARARAYASIATNADIATVIPYDDTIPQNTEGTEILSAAITPASTSNRVRVSVTLFGSSADNASSPGPVTIIAPLFRDSVADALHATAIRPAMATQPACLSFVFEHTPATTSPITYKVRVGPAAAGTMRLNGSTTGRIFGGVAAATMVVEEIAP